MAGQAHAFVALPRLRRFEVQNDNARVIEVTEISLAELAAGRVAMEAEARLVLRLTAPLVPQPGAAGLIFPRPRHFCLPAMLPPTLRRCEMRRERSRAGPIRWRRWRGWTGSATNPPSLGRRSREAGRGILGTTLADCFEVLPARAVDDLGLPLFRFTYHDSLMALDQQDQRIYFCKVSGRETLTPSVFVPRFETSDQPPVFNFTPDAYTQAVERAIEYIRAGDIFQVNLSQHFTAGLPQSPERLYRVLHQQAPALVWCMR